MNDSLSQSRLFKQMLLHLDGTDSNYSSSVLCILVLLLNKERDSHNFAFFFIQILLSFVCVSLNKGLKCLSFFYAHAHMKPTI